MELVRAGHNVNLNIKTTTLTTTKEEIKGMGNHQTAGATLRRLLLCMIL